MEGSFFVLVVFFIWFFVLSMILTWIFINFRRLSKEVNKGNLIAVLNKVLEKEDQNTKSIVEVKKQLEWLINEERIHIQKVGLIRFNPFEELGGDHSFALSVLDGRDSGFIITGLHTRERTRVYVKQIVKGKSKIELSREEVKALALALKTKDI